MKQLGYFQYASLTIARTLATILGGTIPGRARYALIQAEAQDVRWTDDGVTTPTASIGMVLAAGDSLIYDLGPLINLKVIEVTATATLNVSLYG